MESRALTTDDLPAIHAAFLEAFSDYAVPFRPTTDELREMLRRRGWVPGASVAFFDEGRIVAFTLNALGEWNGRPTGYDTGTGVVPSHRGRGLSRAMLDRSIEYLRARGAVQYLLEVLQANARALAIYRDAGFEVTRELQCWRLEATDPATVHDVEVLAEAEIDPVASFFDVAPSWQNSIASIRRAGAPRSILGVRQDGRVIGCAVVFESGDLPLLAVERSARRRGVGRRLLAAAAAGRALRILNVDTALVSADPFLTTCGAAKTVAQYEMLRAI